MRRRALPAAGLLLAVLLSGCGAGGSDAQTPGTTAAGTAPGLASALDRVDAAVVSDDPDRIAAAVQALRRVTASAVADGTLSASRADRIDAAALALLDTVPTPTPTPTPTTAPDESEEAEESGEAEDQEDPGKPGKPAKGGDRGKVKDERKGPGAPKR
ncbi:hypothetical protein K8Z61_09525 [Nocardioides sp. TRM66260-LWL]|uniref:hypothetical protein n=1 Tax=Nocardioides sp. TRM66260-LWL TaxID=2874478 RepID=UPI001CC4C3C3|nr:hypothetical protein [Nocardioides sp. TRM66260-LWL]MBZ5734735.1 hypothetical protein [Nocardioides sp. TRM66260-LWL]